MQSIMEFLGHELLLGRAPGTRGGDLSEIYVKSLYKLLNFKPGFKGKYQEQTVIDLLKTIMFLLISRANQINFHLPDLVFQLFPLQK